ncbi:phosphate regulon sensor histidine kinase PhoR [Viridibacterium curvum]|uniref:Phosphate regulon sensor protein PhoR n=1 Tax=Viridibacterium curvum TaxID=1101404 RepID=A0ABP9QMW5_9RHOO
MSAHALGGFTIFQRRDIWLYWLGALAALLFCALIAGALLGMTVGCGVFIAGLLLMVVWHLRYLAKLFDWTRQPLGTPVPSALGSWGHVLAALSRRSRIAYDQRERLSQSLARFREAAQAMPDGVIYLTRQHLIEWINVAAERHFGIDAVRDVGGAITNLVRHPDFVSYVDSGDYTEPLLLHPLRSEGLTLSVQIVPFGEDLMMLISRDISQLERLETMRRDFVANVSHELKTPLTVISGFQEMLHDGFEDFTPDDARRYLSLAMEQSTRMQRLIEDLLALSSLETSATVPDDEQVDVQTLMRMVGDEARALSAGRHTIEIDAGPSASLSGSGKELHSLLANLASNAVRYTPEGGTVRLVWQATQEGGELVVEDNGPGIAPQHLPRLTERFYRVDRGRSREMGGTGLGLAIVKHVLTRHQGSLDIDSEPGRGSRFAARLPARRIHWNTPVER